MGTVLSIPTAGLIAGSLGWEAVFYIHGGLAAIWLILWAILVSDNPESNRFMSDTEKQFIADHHAHSERADDHQVSLNPKPEVKTLTLIKLTSLI